MVSQQQDPETLLSLLKDKAKELKLTQKKLSKVEDKFVETHKQQKALLSDRDTFEQFLKRCVFADHPSILEEICMQDVPDNYGLYDITQLSEFYTHVQNERSKATIREQDSLKDQIEILTLKSEEIPPLQASLKSHES